ncbi:hypothetical protein DE146DRAFT_670431 [Phaeosphaeria sp. MPI-PUGE-AT-0046c]|nr:hypothetical protein DE146DRAFT_670431 [Phaeosphaeria sp. MPI-PUGE-AT-0046c]
MNDGPSPMSYMGSEGPSSPKRKKMRQKYAPKACVSCRRSKLKCTGEVPCQRCVDNGKRCFYSEDQTAAEVLQNLSRPTPTPVIQSSSFSNGNGHVASRLSAVPQNTLPQRRPSDNGPAGMTMEQRMARMEAMMEALAQNRGLHFTPSGSLEREESLGHRSESAFSMPILDPIHPALEQMVQQPPEQSRQLEPSTEPLPRLDATVLVRIGGHDQPLPFPDEFSHILYVSTFFGDIHLRHPCIDKADFHARTSKILANGAIETTDVHFLALCYIVFACSQAVNQDPLPPGADDNDHPGWRWYLLADGLIDKKALLGGCDPLVLIQYLLFQSLYFAYADMPALAYGAIRTTCTAVLQHNFHQQSTWAKMEDEHIYHRLCVLWNVVVSDRAISLSCGRPASLNMEDLNVELPGNFLDQSQADTRLYEIYPQPDDERHNTNGLLQYQIRSAELANSLLTEVQVTNNNPEMIQSILLVDCGPDMKPEHDLLAPNNAQANTLQISMTLKRIAVGLIVGRKFVSSLEHTRNRMILMSSLVCDSFRRVKDVPGQGPWPSCHYQLTSVVAGILLALGFFLLQDCSSYPEVSQQRSSLYSIHLENFMDAANFLSRLAHSNHYARRVRDEFSTITSVVTAIDQSRRRLAFSGARVDEFDYEDAKDLIPPNVLDSFPYTASSPDLSSRSGVVWLF